MVAQKIGKCAERLRICTQQENATHVGQIDRWTNSLYYQMLSLGQAAINWLILELL